MFYPDQHHEDFSAAVSPRKQPICSRDRAFSNLFAEPALRPSHAAGRARTDLCLPDLFCLEQDCEGRHDGLAASDVLTWKEMSIPENCMVVCGERESSETALESCLPSQKP